ncbi:MAG: tRNA (guanine-N(1)-)-methyltransferase [Elusimicrobia bacterium]|nr:tRNA (guanine-N(1)-)-methyltransferase [Elusimicrobiota bacterium]
MFEGPLTESLMGRAQRAGLIELKIHNLRDWSDDERHQKVDDRPYGGGAGMVLRPEPIFRALKELQGTKKRSDRPWIIFTSPQGEKFTQKMAEKLAKKKRMIVLCGHYEGIDERVMPLIDQEVSIGDFVLTGGELPAMVIIDALARLVPGVVGDPDSVKNESFSTGILDYPHYTRPSHWRGKKVPQALLSGNHKEIEKWRTQAAIRQTKKKRPSLLKEKF